MTVDDGISNPSNNRPFEDVLALAYPDDEGQEEAAKKRKEAWNVVGGRVAKLLRARERAVPYAGQSRG